MRRLILASLLLMAGAPPTTLPDAPPLHPSPAFAALGPATAAGAVVWLHGSYDKEPGTPPPAVPPWVDHLAADRYDIWRFDRPEADPLAPGGESVIRGVAALKAAGYRRVIVAGDSRGAFIGLYALAAPGLVDAVAAIDPAAHGTSPSRRAKAMADFQDRLAAAATPMRFALVQLRDDDFDPDPDGRVEMARQMAKRTGMELMVIDRPPAPTGHMGGDEPTFDAIFGVCLTRFLEGKAGADACAGT